MYPVSFGEKYFPQLCTIHPTVFNSMHNAQPIGHGLTRRNELCVIGCGVSPHPFLNLIEILEEVKMKGIHFLKVLAVITIFSLFAACTPSAPVAAPTAQPVEITRQVEITRMVQGTPEIITATPGPATPTTAPATQKHITLKIWDQFSSDPGKTVMDKIYSGFMAKYPYITISRQLVPTGQADQTARTALASGAGPDIVYLDVSPTQDLIDAGLIRSLDDYSNLYDWPSLFTQQGLKYTMYKGKLWGLGAESEFVGTWVNNTLFKKENWTVPTTLSDVLAWCPKAVAKGYKIPFSNWIGDYGSVFGWMASPLQNYVGVDYINGLLFNQTGTWDSPDMIRAIEIVQGDMRKAGCFGTEPITDYTAATDLFYQQKSLFMVMGTWEMPAVNAWAVNNNLDISYQPFFDMQNGHPPVFTQGMGSAWYISQASKNSDTAALFLNYFFADPEVRRMYIQEGGYFPPTKYDTSLYNLSPIQKMVADELQKENSMGWDLDVLLPHSWAVTNFDGATSVWLGKETVPQLMTSLQKVYEQDYLSKFNK
jgi:ABC-type glycerol-3-phosphate transport system substrate-binding protein